MLACGKECLEISALIDSARILAELVRQGGDPRETLTKPDLALQELAHILLFIRDHRVMLYDRGSRGDI